MQITTEAESGDPIAHIIKTISFETKSLPERVASAVTDMFIANGLIVFGSYVREYLCERPFNPSISTISISSYDMTVSDVEKLLHSNGFRCSCIRSSEKIYDRVESINFKVGLINDVLLTGQYADIDISFYQYSVPYKNKIQPPFNHLEFTCDAWIWDIHGIRLSRNTGTSLDKLSTRETKNAEISIINESKNFITQYHPVVEGSASSHLNRLECIDNMIFSGWKFTNLNIMKTSEHDGICTICYDTIIGDSVELQCCNIKYHRQCFVNYGKNELNNSQNYIRCPQRCSKLFI
jgi:hypothetical protein